MKKKLLKFSKHIILPENVIFESNTSFAFLNIKPLIDGHVLICPKKKTKRLTDLKDNDLENYLLDIQKMRNFLNFLHNSKIKMGIQDGKEAGQSINHLHTHLIPFEENFIANSQKKILTSEELFKLSLRYKISIRKFFLKQEIEKTYFFVK